MKFAIAVLIIIACTQQAWADARSIETAACSVTINGHTGAPMNFSLENMREPKILAQGDSFILQAKPLLENPVMNDRLQDTVNPYGLEILTGGGKIEGTHAFHYGEGTSTLKSALPLLNGQLVEIDATCTVSYAE